jgi:hypothetical protein
LLARQPIDERVDLAHEGRPGRRGVALRGGRHGCEVEDAGAWRGVGREGSEDVLAFSVSGRCASCVSQIL